MSNDFHAELESMAEEFGLELNPEPETPFTYGNWFIDDMNRWLRPIGPAPEGWQVKPTCSHTIPHNDEAEQWMNDDMNEDHYATA